MLRIPWIDHVSNNKVLEKMDTKKTLILYIRKRYNEEGGF